MARISPKKVLCGFEAFGGTGKESLGGGFDGLSACNCDISKENKR